LGKKHPGPKKNRYKSLFIQHIDEEKNRGTGKLVCRVYGVEYTIVLAESGRVWISNISVPPGRLSPNKDLQAAVVLGAYNYFKKYPLKPARLI
jgi:hypothetical protein